MRELVERGWFLLCLILGQVLRSAKYSTARIVQRDGAREVRKYRSFYAPVLVSMGGPLMRILDTGVQVLPRRDWEARERSIYAGLRRGSIRTNAQGTLVLPCLAGETLAALLDDPALEESVRRRAIELAVGALAEFHGMGFTHGDAMAENVLVDLEAGVAHWLDFETVHDSGRSIAWRRADDLRALLVGCLFRTVTGKRPEALRLVLDVYRDEGVTRLVASTFSSVWQRPLSFHLGQAPLPYRCFREIAALLGEPSAAACLRETPGVIETGRLRSTR